MIEDAIEVYLGENRSVEDVPRPISLRVGASDERTVNVEGVDQRITSFRMYAVEIRRR